MLITKNQLKKIILETIKIAFHAAPQITKIRGKNAIK